MQVDLIDYLGDDLRVVNSARVSFGKESEWEFIETNCGDDCCWTLEQKLSEKDQKLISYLAKHNHFTPFTHVVITMREKVPIFVARQRFKHMVGFTYNEVSRRYVDETPEFFVPDVWRGRAENKKQGSSDEEINLWDYSWHDQPEGDWGSWSIGEEFAEMMERIQQTYRRMIEVGVAPEQARMVLPQSMYTEYYVTGSLAAWARAYKLRNYSDAQKEIRDLAAMWNEKIGSIEELKYSWKALTE